MHEIFSSLVAYLTNFVSEVGYLGIFIGMFLESTLVPLPSELVMIPAGLAVASGSMSFCWVLISGVAGNVAGAIFSYYLALSIGRALLFKVGKYFFVKAATIIKIEDFFKNHGSISIFIGRLLPGFRHFISLPAGVARMDIGLFIFYTTAGSAIWNAVLIMIGYFVGTNQGLIEENLHTILLSTLAFCVALIVAYIFLKPVRK